MPQGAGLMYIEPRSPVRTGFSKTAVKPSSSTTLPSTPAKSTPSPRHGKSVVKTLLWLSPLVTVLPYMLSKLHYSLPEPRQESHLSDGTPVVSEANIMKHIQELENIGYRIVGTEEAEQGEIYVFDQAEALANKCAMSDVLECNLWYQKGDGMHQFDIMDHAVLKSYRGIGNVILQIGGVNTTRTIEGDPINNAILLNAHIDSALPSPGAADDGVGVGVMLDCARVLIERDQHIAGSAIFLFNGAEETLQDASHLYSMQHETKDLYVSMHHIRKARKLKPYYRVKAVINLEAAGSTGGALLFQATSKEMIEAYSKVPRPHGTVVAADVFSSGIIMSEYVFGQRTSKFADLPQQMAIVGHSYYYHTQRDTVANLQPGSSQHFADATMAVLDHLLQVGSPLNTDTPWSPPNMVYYSLYDRIFVYYSMNTANLLCACIMLVYVGILATRVQESDRKVYQKALAAAFGNLFVGILGETADQAVQEHAAALGAIGFEVIFMALMQAFQLRSAYLFSNMAIIGLVPLLLNEAYSARRNKTASISFGLFHWLWTALSVSMIVEASTNFLDIFVPLTGGPSVYRRMGKEAPTEIIIAVLASFLIYVFLPPLVPLFQRFNRASQRNILVVCLLSSSLIIAIFASPAWSSYDDTHPKRAGIQYMYNVTSGTHTLHVAQLDSGPGFPEFVTKVHERYGMQTRMPVQSVPSDSNSDWDILYPISAFIEAEKFPVIGHTWPAAEILPEVRVRLTEDTWDNNLNTRNITLSVNHEGLIYPVLAFSADVVEWSFQTAAPVGHTRHYVKAASSPGKEDFVFHMSLKTQNQHDELGFHWVGIGIYRLTPLSYQL
ncbi:hypothetical protein QFC22_002183 [Naganishia vaughanmartiniae]|uniref:Uncharacterized protein n=1 Tax=Naganishia vaughanmartiniae TaxID=1424756 RepID=A0ACC2XDQ4_9TREE|nr:hypothetical protein QFC22_002183 [Naganishia vaughanmartiniae]